jgi:hypothetical protein
VDWSKDLIFIPDDPIRFSDPASDTEGMIA